MAQSSVIRFQPLYHTRVWGGRELENIYGRDLPDAQPYGESWEIVDRPEAQSVVREGPFQGQTLHDLWSSHRTAIFGKDAPESERFPLLLKILDARDVLSVQVHPPANLAEALGGEPKTEMWFIADARPDAALYIGVKPGMDRQHFASAIAAGTVDHAIHRLPVQRGDFVFIPSGRLHAIGAGLVIFEIQQNSDTTYRVFDWNRTGLDGKPRDLHVEESLQCIDFTDTHPVLGAAAGPTLVSCPEFHVQRHHVPAGHRHIWSVPGEFSLGAVVTGHGHIGSTPALPGDHFLVPANAEAALDFVATSESTILKILF
jgi:mannose-6-phosphate isomerase